jgi:cell division protein FtsB
MFGQPSHRKFGFFRLKIWMSLFLVVVLGLLLSAQFNVLNKTSAIDDEINALKTEAARAQAQNSGFKKMVQYLQSNQFVEEQAKLKMGLKQEGEKVVVVTTSSNSPAVVNDSEPVVSDDISETVGLQERWQRWFDYFLLEK